MCVVSKENHHDTSAVLGNVDIDFFVRSRCSRLFYSITSDGVVSVCVCASRIFGSACVAPLLGFSIGDRIWLINLAR